MFVLVNILRNRIGKWTHCCFIDLRKAFDRVWRNGLWKRLWDEGIRGKFWRVCKNMYEDTKSCVLLGKERTDFFDVSMGVKQGCTLSPILFSIFINTLAKEIEESGIGVVINGIKVAILLYADDIVIIASSEDELKQGLRIVTDWGKKWRCSFNQDKSKVVVFGQRKKKGEVTWTLGGKIIEQVNTYKYLGLDLRGNLRWNMLRDRLAEKTRRNMNIAWAMGIQSGHLSVVAADKVWKVLVRPIAEYGAAIWGEGRWDEMEKVQRDMGKRILGLDQSTSNEVILGEMGWWTMQARRDMLRLRYWKKLLNMDRRRLPRKVYDWERGKTSRKTWCTYTEKLLLELGLEEKWEKQTVIESNDEWNRLIKEKIQLREQERWWKEMKEKPKLRTYRLIKTKLTFEDYLRSDDTKGRKLMTRLRSGTNFLRIETGRREGLCSEERKCWFCCNEMEDENHFLMKCHLYDDLREQVGNCANEADDNDKDPSEKIKNSGSVEDGNVTDLAMMLGRGNKDQLAKVLLYIKRAVARRNRILDTRESINQR